MTKLLLLLVLVSSPALAATFSVDGFSGKIHNYAKSVSPQLEVIINWQFDNGANHIIAQGNVVARVDSSGSYTFQEFSKAAATASHFSLWVELDDLKSNRQVFVKNVTYTDGKSVSSNFNTLAIYDFAAISTGEIKTKSGQALTDYLKSQGQTGLLAEVVVNYQNHTPLFSGPYDLTNKTATINSQGQSIVFKSIDPGPNPKFDLNFYVVAVPKSKLVYTKTLSSVTYTGTIPAALVTNAEIDDETSNAF